MIFQSETISADTSNFCRSQGNSYRKKKQGTAIHRLQLQARGLHGPQRREEDQGWHRLQGMHFSRGVASGTTAKHLRTWRGKWYHSRARIIGD